MSYHNLRRTQAQAQLDRQPYYADQFPDRGAVQQDALSLTLYCHDTYGLGHLRYILSLDTHTPSTSQPIVTGTPVAHNFPFPEGADYIKLPSIVKVGAEQYEPRFATGVRP